MWVQIKATGDMIAINLDKDRPASFESKKAEVEWERATAKNALLLKAKIEANEYIPEEVRRKIEAKAVRSKEEEELLKKSRQINNRSDKVGEVTFYRVIVRGGFGLLHRDEAG